MLDFGNNTTAGFYRFGWQFLSAGDKNGVEALKNELQGTARFQIYSECSVTNDATC